MRTILFPMLLVLLLASGCAVRGPIGSYCGPLPEANAVSAIAADAVDCLTSLYPPGHTSIHLAPAKDVENAFVQVFEDRLRAKGFTLAASPTPDSIVIAYTLDAMDEKSAWYLQLRISDEGEHGKSIARAYTETGQPEAGQSRTDIVFRRSMLERAVDKTKKTTGEAYDATRSFLTE
jgi:Conjugal transfer protein TrbH.